MTDLVVSSSSIMAFKRCRKSYYYLYELLREPKTTNAAVANGKALHALLDRAAAAPGPLTPRDEDEAAMYPVVEKYLAHKPLPKNIKGTEQQVFTELLPAGTLCLADGTWVDTPRVILRTTFDMIYAPEDMPGWIIGRDYKSFEKAPTLNMDLDFQARIYSAALLRAMERKGSKKYTDAGFEFEYIRRVPIGSPNSKGFWKPEECVITELCVFSRNELDELWAETQCVARDLVRTRAEARLYAPNKPNAIHQVDAALWYREDLKVGPHSCSSCFVKDLCLADVRGTLDHETIDMLTVARDPLALPDGHHLKEGGQ